MAKKKKLEKSIKSFEKQIELHKEKLEKYSKEKDYLGDYCEKQIRIFRDEIEKKKKRV